jgi:hypothetical protein
MNPGISEFSYGFALTSELIQSPEFGLTAAPVFPSLIEEGRSGGHDVRLDRPSLPLFLQFKLSHFMQRRTCREVRDAEFEVPCYRMYLRAARLSRQHELLLELEDSAEGEVYYSAPSFHLPEELNNAFLTHQVRARSVWIRPSEIGPLPDDDEHHVSFSDQNPWTMFSTPRRLSVRRRVAELFAGYATRLRTKRGPPGTEWIENLAESVERIASKRADVLRVANHDVLARTRKLQPLDRAAYYASVFLESQMYLVQLRSEQA